MHNNAATAWMCWEDNRRGANGGVARRVSHSQMISSQLVLIFNYFVMLVFDLKLFLRADIQQSCIPEVGCICLHRPPAAHAVM